MQNGIMRHRTSRPSQGAPGWYTVTVPTIIDDEPGATRNIPGRVHDPRSLLMPFRTGARTKRATTIKFSPHSKRASPGTTVPYPRHRGRHAADDDALHLELGRSALRMGAFTQPNRAGTTGIDFADPRPVSRRSLDPTRRRNLWGGHLGNSRRARHSRPRQRGKLVAFVGAVA